MEFYRHLYGHHSNNYILYKILQLCAAISLLALDHITFMYKLGKFSTNFEGLFPAQSMKICLLVFLKTWKDSTSIKATI